MSPTAVPTRITIDFRDAALPSRTWILGVDEGAAERLELIAFEGHHRSSADRAVPRTPAFLAECACPDFCERDHANE